MKKLKNIMFSKEKIKTLLLSSVDFKTVKIIEGMVMDGLTLKNSLSNNGIVGMEALEIAEDLFDDGHINESELGVFEVENEAIDRAMAKMMEEVGEDDDDELVDESEIFAMFDF